MSGRASGTAIGGLVGTISGLLLAGPYGAVVGGVAATLFGVIGGYTGGLVGEAIAPTHDERFGQEKMVGVNVQVSQLGTPIPQYFGDGAGAGNILYLGNRTREMNVGPGGSKGGGNNSRAEYKIDLVIGIADTRLTGPLDDIRRIFADGNILYDRASGRPSPEGWTFYPGNAVGEPSAVIEATQGVGNVPGYPYLARMDILRYSMGTFPRIPNFTFQVYQRGSAMSSFEQMRMRPIDTSLWIAAPGVNQVLVVDSTTQMETHAIDVDVLNVGTPATFSDPHPTAVGFPMGFEGGSDALWIAHPADYMLKRIDGATKAVTHVFPVPYSFLGGGFWHEGTMWFCAHDYTNTIGYVIRATTAGVTATIAAGQARGGIMQMVAASATAVWVTDNHYPDGGGNSNALRINPNTNTITATVSLGSAATSRPVDIVVTPTDDHVWVLDQIAQTVLRIDTTPAVVATIALPGGALPLQLAVASDGYVWVASSANGGTLYRINPATNTAVARESVRCNPTSNPAVRMIIAGANGTMWVVSRADSVVQHMAPDGTSVALTTGGTPKSLVAENATHIWTGTTRGELRRMAEDTTLSPSSIIVIPRLKGILAVLAGAAGIPANELDFSDMPANPMIGLKLNAVQSVRSIMDILLEGYQAFGFESNRGLKFRSRQPTTIVETIPEDELDAHDGRGDPPSPRGLIVGIIPDEDLPTRFDVTYVSRARDYEQDIQSAYVSNSHGVTNNPKHVNTGLIFTAGQAKRLAQETLDQLWLTRVRYQQSLRRIYMRLEPGDLIAVIARDATHRIILGEVAYERPGIVRFTGRGDVTDHINVFEGFISQGGNVTFIPTEFHTIGHLLNLPAIDSADQTPRYHVGYTYPGPVWPGVSLLRSVDGGSSYAEVDFTDDALATTGIVASALGIGSPYTIDTNTTFSVVLDVGASPLLSISDTALLAGGNPIQIGAEVLQFADAALTGTRTYTCGRLLRGLRGTELAISTHGNDERFILLNTAIRRISMTLSDRNVSRFFKAVTSGLDASAVTPQSFTPASPNLTPWAVGTPQSTLLSGDWVCTWLARSRFAGEWVDGGGFGYDQDFMHFRLRVYADATFAVIKRDMLVEKATDPESIQTATYTEAMQTEDFDSPITTLYWAVRAISSYGSGQMVNLTTTS